MSSITTRALITLSAAAVIASLSGSVAAGELARRPARGQEQRTSEVTIERFEKSYRVERERTEMKKWAVFHAEPATLEGNAIVLFEITSVSGDKSTPRWRCVAVSDVAECLGQAVKIRYLPDDEKVVLTATAKPKDSAEAMALIESTRNSNARALAVVER